MSPVAPGDHRFFFVHVMKTGGTTFRWMHLQSNFYQWQVYPNPRLDGDMQYAYILVQPLLALPEERRRRIRAYSGHFPYVVAGMLDPALVTLTILRDPVERTISHLKHSKRYHDQHRELSLEEIYEDPFYQPVFFRDHQVKMFAMTADDPLESHMDVVDIDDARLRAAKAHLEHVDVLGLNEHLDDFLGELQDRYGWTIRDRASHRVSDEDWEVSTSLRRRIERDSAADVEFYEYARELYARQR